MLNVCDLTLWSGASMVVASSGRHPQLDHLVDARRFDQLVSHPAALWLKRVFHQSSLWVPSAIATWRPVKPAVAPAGPGSASFAGAGSGSVSSTRTPTCRQRSHTTEWDRASSCVSRHWILIGWPAVFAGPPLLHLLLLHRAGPLPRRVPPLHRAAYRKGSIGKDKVKGIAKCMGKNIVKGAIGKDTVEGIPKCMRENMAKGACGAEASCGSATAKGRNRCSSQLQMRGSQALPDRARPWSQALPVRARGRGGEGCARGPREISAPRGPLDARNTPRAARGTCPPPSDGSSRSDCILLSDVVSSLGSSLLDEPKPGAEDPAVMSGLCDGPGATPGWLRPLTTIRFPRAPTVLKRTRIVPWKSTIAIWNITWTRPHSCLARTRRC